MNSNQLGKLGEQLFKQIMESRGYIVEDVTAAPFYWDKDIDFIITSTATGITKSFEVKTDSRIANTGNLYLELESINSKQWNGGGWFPNCQADYLVYMDAINKIFYVIAMQDLRQAANTLPYREAKCGYDSVGQLIALKDIQNITQVL